MSSSSKTAIIILVLVGIANFSYAGYRTYSGLEGSSIPLIIAGIMCLTLSAILMTRSRKG